MPRFRCPECNVESEVSATHGREVVALYCLRHTGGADSHTRPVYMVCVESSVPARHGQAVRPAAAGVVTSGRTHRRIDRHAVEEEHARPAAVNV